MKPFETNNGTNSTKSKVKPAKRATRTRATRTRATRTRATRTRATRTRANDQPENEDPNLVPEAVINLFVFCEICDKPVPEKTLLAHKRRSHGKRLRCSFCSGSFATRMTLNHHERKYHYGKTRILKRHRNDSDDDDDDDDEVKQQSDTAGIDEVWNCRKCKANFPTRMMLSNHERDEHDCKYRCQKCHKNYLYERSLKTHLCKGKYEKYTCEFCDLHFVSPDHLSIHLKSCLPSEYERKCNRNYRICKNCTGSFKSLQEKRSHKCPRNRVKRKASVDAELDTNPSKKTKRKEKPIEKKQHSNETKEKEHSNETKKDIDNAPEPAMDIVELPQFWCLLCGVGADTKEELDKHSCPQPRVELERLNILETHVCTICNGIFFNLKDMNEHSCVPSTPNYGYEIPHQSNVEVADSPVNRSKYHCNDCNITFAKKRDRRLHSCTMIATVTKRSN